MEVPSLSEDQHSFLEELLGGDRTTVYAMLEAGINPNFLVELGGQLTFPLRIAVEIDDPDFVKKMLEYGASDISAGGQTARDLAVQYGFSDIVALLDGSRSFHHDFN